MQEAPEPADASIATEAAPTEASTKEGIADSEAAPADHYPVTIAHDFGELTFTQTPERVVVIREELLESLLVLGVQPVGYGGRLEFPAGDRVTDHPYLPQDVLGTPTYIGNPQSPSLERIVELNPDLILFPNDGGAATELYDSFAEIAPTLAFNPGARGAWKEIVTKLGVAFNQEEQAAEAIANFEAQTEDLRADLSDAVEAAPLVAVVYLPSPNSTWILGRDFALGGMVEELGFTAVQPDGLDLGPSGASEIDVEALSNLDTDIIFTIQLSAGVQEGFQAERLLASLNAPIVRGVLETSRPYTGPFSERFYQEQFHAEIREVYGE
ncbi:MAG: ABC transporter substrate-binding protein [Chloroflexales bacterium]|nr:ABC transporter substrate-binding protein [Chloroflexales bacterium]